MNPWRPRLRRDIGGRRRGLAMGALVWAAVAFVFAIGSLDTVNRDSRLLVGAATIVGALAAVAAARQLARGSDRAAGCLLVVSVLTPSTSRGS